MLLSANSLSLSYNGHNVVEGFNLSIPKRTIVGLVGPNGSGKTTILRALAGLIEPARGRRWCRANMPRVWTSDSAPARLVGFRNRKAPPGP